MTGFEFCVAILTVAFAFLGVCCFLFKKGEK